MNDIENAIARIKRGIQLAVEAKDDTTVSELKVTLEALEKQVSVKATAVIPYRAQKCSCCDQWLEPFWDYCPSCGQAFENVI